MGKHVKFALMALVAGSVILAGAKIAEVFRTESTVVESSDAKGLKGKLVIGIDNWIGYFPLCSQDMRSRMRQSGYLLVCEDDSADYPGRMKKLADGYYQLAVATVDSYLLNGYGEHYPATVIAVIDESKGGDAAVAWQDQVASLDVLKQSGGFRIAFTPNSPSHHLLKSMAVHFDIPLPSDEGWRVESDGSPDALERFLRKESAVAVLWEPDVSRALQQEGVIKLLGTEDTDKLIVDVLLVNRDFSLRDPEAISVLLRNYFLTLKHYRDHPDRLVADASRETNLPKDDVKTLLAAVAWQSLADNARNWFGVSGAGAAAGSEGIVEAIDGAVQILRDAGDFSRNPVPDGDPYRLMNSRFVGELYRGGATAWTPTAASGASVALDRRFPPLSAGEWDRLREIGTLKVRPIVFQSGTANLTIEGKAELDKAMENLKHYPNFRVVVKGHTGIGGDPEANRQLSLERAESVARYLGVTYGIDGNRLNAVGFGSEKPLPRAPGESTRAYNYRLPRVELFLVTEDI